MNMNKPIATAKQLYDILDGVARSLQNCQPEGGDSAVESSVKTRVASEILLILEEAGYPVAVAKMTEYCLLYKVELKTMFNEGDYQSVIEAIQCILTGSS